MIPMSIAERDANRRNNAACIDCRGAKHVSELLCDACVAAGPRGGGRCQVYECFALADGWGSCVFCRRAKARVMP